MSTEPDISLSQSDSEILCPECDYNLTGVPSDRCPWCGWAIDVDAIVAFSHAHVGRRIGVVVASLVVCFGTLLAAYSLGARGQRLSLFDMIAVAGPMAAAGGHFVLAVLVVLSWSQRWPLRRGEVGTILHWVAWGSIAAGVIGGIPALNYAPTKLVVQNTVVNGPLEFMLSVILFSLPAFMLLLLLMIAFRPRRRAVGETVLPANDTSRGTRAPFSIDFARRFSAEQISQKRVTTPRLSNQMLDLAISQTWDAETAIAREFNRTMFNGKLVRLIRCLEHADSLHVELGPTDYRDFIGTNLHNLAMAWPLGPEFLSNALGVSATIITSDGFLALGRRSERVASHMGCLHPFGGMLEQADQKAEGTCDLFGSVRREACEELGLQPGEIRDITLVGLARDHKLMQPELIFDVQIKLTKSQLIERFDPGLSHGEHERIEVVRDEPDCLLPFLEHTPSVTPIAQAAVLIHGRHLWGREWYEQASYLLYGDVPGNVT